MTEPAAHTMRNRAVLVLLGSLGLTAIAAVLALWTPIDPDGLLLVSTLMLAVASLLGLCGAARLDRNPKAPAGMATLLLTIIAVTATLWLIWTDPSNPGVVLQGIFAAWLWSLTFALHSLIALARAPKRLRWLSIVAPAALYVLAAMLTPMLFEQINFSTLAYFYSVVAVTVVALLTSLAVLFVHIVNPD